MVRNEDSRTKMRRESRPVFHKSALSFAFSSAAAAAILAASRESVGRLFVAILMVARW